MRSLITALLVAACAAGACVHECCAQTNAAADSASAFSFPLLFDSEEIHLRVQSDSLIVDGTYRLICNLGKGTTYIVYPFPTDPRMGAATPVRMEIRAPGGEWKRVSCSALPRGAGLRCRVPLLAKDTLELHAVYRQKLMENYARYIVTSTRAWGRPLRSALFLVTLPEGMELFGASYPFAPDGENLNRYRFLAENFWPEKDIVIEWQPAEAPPDSTR
ncbi:MAG: hypothetical protein KBD56_05955 [Candidatus Eisenbacteria bacterium]|nr:hypothetical protein [Candidatus Eisenbacteria bacterium]